MTSIEKVRYSSRFDPAILDRVPETRERFQRFLEWAVGPVRPEIALDLGCGTGLYHPVLAPLVGKLVAVDSSPTMLEQARRVSEMRGLGTELVCGSAEDLPFPDRTFDFVMAYDVLHHVADIPAVAEEVYRVLKPGGRFAAAETTMWSPLTLVYNLLDSEEWGALRIRPGCLTSAFARFDRFRLHPDNTRFFPHAAPLEWTFNVLDRYVLRGPLRSMSARYLIEAWTDRCEADLSDQDPNGK